MKVSKNRISLVAMFAYRPATTSSSMMPHPFGTSFHLPGRWRLQDIKDPEQDKRNNDRRQAQREQKERDPLADDFINNNDGRIGFPVRFRLEESFGGRGALCQAVSLDGCDPA